MVGVFELRDLQAEGLCAHRAHLFGIWLIGSSRSGLGRYPTFCKSLPREGGPRIIEQQSSIGEVQLARPQSLRSVFGVEADPHRKYVGTKFTPNNSFLWILS